jgi:endonuclease/exonuclease/phosphatase family metal-dependent hydrolase
VSHLLTHSLFRSAENLPTLLIGDSNDWRNRLQAGLLGPVGFHQVTTPISRFRTFPSYLAMGSLDKAFIRGEISIRQARVVRSRLARIASDHLPLVIDFHLNGPHRERPENGEARRS